MPGRPETRYARSGEAHVAYQVTGAGPVDVVVTPGFISHLDLQWEGVAYRRFVRLLAAFARVIRYDKRGTGLSDPVAAVPTLEHAPMIWARCWMRLARPAPLSLSGL